MRRKRATTDPKSVSERGERVGSGKGCSSSFSSPREHSMQLKNIRMADRCSPHFVRKRSEDGAEDGHGLQHHHCVVVDEGPVFHPVPLWDVEHVVADPTSENGHV